MSHVFDESCHVAIRVTGWRRLIGSPKLQIIFHKRATEYTSLLQKMTYKDKGSYESSPPCICILKRVVSNWKSSTTPSIVHGCIRCVVALEDKPLFLVSKEKNSCCCLCTVLRCCSHSVYVYCIEVLLLLRLCVVF